MGSASMARTADSIMRQGDYARASELRQQAVGLGAQLLRLGALVLDEIPFVEADHHRPALAFGEVGQRQILLLERDRRIQQQDDDFGEAHCTQGVGDRELFELLDDARAPAQAGGVEELDPPIAPRR